MLQSRKIENNCINCFFFQVKKLTIKWHLSQSLTFQIITCWKAWEYLGILQVKSKRMLLYHLYQKTVLLRFFDIHDFRVEIYFMPKWKCFWFQKTSFTYYRLSLAINVFLWDWAKVFVSEGCAQAPITITA